MATNTAEQITSFTRLSLHMSAGWTTLLCFLAGTIIFLWLCRTPCSKPAASLADDGPDPPPPTHKGVHLVEVTHDRDEADTDIDIIAIHGLDTTSRDTWTWKDPRYPKNNRTWVNWLHPGMLPESVDCVRIFTCDWPADLLVPSDSVQKTIEEYALLLLEGIENAIFAGSPRQQDRYIVFIASCLGGLILTRALVRADDRRNRYYRIRAATRGIVFLATPFRGTSFQDVAAWAETGLRAKAALQGREVSRLLDSTKGSTFELEESIGKLTQLCQHKDNPCEVFAFYELGTTSLPHRAFPWLPGWFHQRKQLVDRSSATLDIIPDPLPLDRPHSLMNKFRDPQCPDYKKVAGQIRGMVGKIRAGTPLEQVDTWIRDKHYTADRLKIERLSGELLPMEQCYINLAIVEQSGQDAGHSRKEGDTAPSPFSILARQKVETPDKTMQVELAALFNERKGRDDRPMHPRRILIRGRAGVGKTTLCKKIVHEFTKGTWAKWNELFDRVLWLPLRNLKLPERRKKAKYTFEHLFSHEYLLPTDGPNLARALSCALDTKSSKTLFLLDGLDELSQDLTGNGSMACFLAELLKRPNIIITSRPSAKAPPNLDLELETIGFGPDQVNEYIERSFTNSATGETDQVKVHKVQSFLQERWLIQGLVRIPIQLDALCYTWEEFDPETVPSTMTGMYNTIVQNLWKKDVVRLEKAKDGYAKDAHAAEIEGRVTAEIALLECLAFNGLHNDVIDFAPVHRAGVVKLCPPQVLSLDETLSRLSFLRTSDTEAKIKHRYYHFIHLTFQEYFAARYFVRQWKDRERLELLTFSGKDTATKVIPIEFLRKHKYTTRYDIFWRFVAGLLDASGQAPDFIKTVEEEPLDLLGPTHQRLVMHCLSEISNNLPKREALEKRLAGWLLFECKFNRSAGLASEVEFPELALETSLLEGSNNTRDLILRSLAERASIPRSIAEQMAIQLDNANMFVRRDSVATLVGRAVLPDGVLMAVAARLDDKDWYVRREAVWALGGRAALPDVALAAMAARLHDEHGYVRSAVIDELRKRAALPDGVLRVLLARLNHKDWSVQRAAVEVLGRQTALPDSVLSAIAARLDDEDAVVRSAVVEVLGWRAALPDNMLLAMAARLSDDNVRVRRAAVEALGRRVVLPDNILRAVSARLDDEEADVRSAAVEALGRRAVLPDNMLRAVSVRLNDNEADVRRAAVKALGMRVALPDNMLRAVLARLDDKEADVRRAAVEALGGRAALPGDMLRAIAARLDDEDAVVRSVVMVDLSKRAAVPDEVLRAVVTRLDHEAEVVRWAAMWTLGQRTALPDGVLKAMAVQLNNKDVDERRAAVDALGGRAELPDEVLEAVAALLDDNKTVVRKAAVEALIGQVVLPDNVLRAVAARLNDNKSVVRRAAVEALSRRVVLPGSILRAVAARLDDRDTPVRKAAVEALSRRVVLPDNILRAVVARLGDNERVVRMAAVQALGRRVTLSEDMLSALAARLDDKNTLVRWAAVRALEGQAALSADVFRTMAAGLDHEDKVVRRAVVCVLMRTHEKFYRTLLRGPLVVSVYKTLLEQSFEEQISWYIDKDKSFVNMPDGIRELSIDIQPNDVREWINGARPTDCPLTIGGETRPTTTPATG